MGGATSLTYEMVSHSITISRCEWYEEGGRRSNTGAGGIGDEREGSGIQINNYNKKKMVKIMMTTINVIVFSNSYAQNHNYNNNTDNNNLIVVFLFLS